MRVANETEYKYLVERDYDKCDFYFGNIHTKIVCSPLCTSKRPLRKNIVIFENLEEAENKGYKPCKRCNHIKSDFKVDYDNWCHDLKDYMDEFYYYDLNLDTISKKVGISKFHLIRSFKKQFDTTPINYLINVRIAKAVLLISRGGNKLADIATMVGFRTYNNFAKNYKKININSPKTGK